MFRTFIREEAGQTATEYMLILSVVVIAVSLMGLKYVGLFGDAIEVVGHRVMVLLMIGHE
jgi:Flp pilus assembly pilin Flp